MGCATFKRRTNPDASKNGSHPHNGIKRLVTIEMIRIIIGINNSLVIKLSDLRRKTIHLIKGILILPIITLRLCFLESSVLFEKSRLACCQKSKMEYYDRIRKWMNDNLKYYHSSYELSVATCHFFNLFTDDVDWEKDLITDDDVESYFMPEYIRDMAREIFHGTRS